VVQGSFVWEPLLLAPTDFHMAVLIGHFLTGDRKAGAHHLKDIAAASGTTVLICHFNTPLLCLEKNDGDSST
jgi:hypothetical protein